MLRQVLTRGSLPRINELVDLCNTVSLEHVLAVAVYDVADSQGDVTVRLATGDETFVPLFATEVEHPRPGEEIYTDEAEALSRRWVWRQCDKAKTCRSKKSIPQHALVDSRQFHQGIAAGLHSAQHRPLDFAAESKASHGSRQQRGAAHRIGRNQPPDQQ